MFGTSFIEESVIMVDTGGLNFSTAMEGSLPVSIVSRYLEIDIAHSILKRHVSECFHSLVQDFFSFWFHL